MGGDFVTLEVSGLIAEGKLYIGDGYRAKNEELAQLGLPFARAGNIDGGFQFKGAECFPETNLSRVGKKISEDGDVVFTSKGTVGRFAFVRPSTPQFVYSPQLCFWRVIDRRLIEPRYLYYWMQGPEFFAQFKGVASQTDMADFVSLSDQRRMKVCLPELRTQQSIAHVLGTLDDKIDLNRRRNDTLEAMAQALFKSWFVDFDPLRGKAEDLLREGILEIGDGYRAKNSELGSPGLPFIRAGDLNKGFDFTGAEVLCDASVAKAGTKICRPGDVAFTSKGTIGRFARVPKQTPRFVYSPQVCFWRSLNHKRLHPAILYSWMLGEDFRSQVDAVAGQTDMAPYVSLRDQREMEVPVFGSAQAGVGGQIESLLERQASLSRESGTLASLRDTLLPKLISGELRIPDVERIVGKAV